MNIEQGLAVGASVSVGVLAFAAETLSDPTWAQGGIVGVLGGVVLYFIKRGDAREEKAKAETREKEAAAAKILAETVAGDTAKIAALEKALDEEREARIRLQIQMAAMQAKCDECFRELDALNRRT